MFVRGVRAGERVRFGGSEVSAFVLFLFSVSFLSLSLCVRRRVLCQTRVSEMGVVVLCVFASSAAPFEREEMMMMLMLKNLLLFHHSLFTLFSLSLSDDDDETTTGNESSTRSSPYLRKRSSARYIREEDSLEPRTRIKFNTRNITTPRFFYTRTR